MNKRIPALAIFIILFSGKVFSQFNFQRLMGGPFHDRAQSFLNSYDNNFIINGATLSYGVGDVDAILMKTNNTGLILWTYAYGTTDYDNSEIAIEAFDHSLVCAGRSNVQPGSTSAIIFKTDSLGTLNWSKVYGLNSNAGFVSIIETFDLGYAAVGNIGSSILFVKTDANGDTLFTRIFEDVENESGSSIIQLSDSSYVICGRQQKTINGNLQSDAILMKTDAAGNLLWTKMYGDSLWEEFAAVQQTSDGGLMIAGSTVTFGAGGFDILLMKTDSSGVVQWSMTYGGAESEAAYDLHLNSDGSCVLSGYTESLGYGHRVDDSTNVFLMKTDDSGNVLWAEVYGDGLQDEAYRSNKANDGGYLISGFTKNYLLTDSSQMFLIKTDSMGITGCHEDLVQPIDSVITMPYQSVNFLWSSGLAIDILSMTTTQVSPNNYDACLFTSAENLKDEKIKIFPVPFYDVLTISGIEENTGIIVSDLMGRLILSTKANSNLYSIETESLSSGLYLISINNNSRKFIVVKN